MTVRISGRPADELGPAYDPGAVTQGPCRLLYIKGIPLDQPNDLTVVVFDPAGRQIGSATIKQSGREPQPWAFWERTQTVAFGQDDAPPEAWADYCAEVSLPSFGAGVPYWPGSQPFVAAGRVSFADVQQSRIVPAELDPVEVLRIVAWKPKRRLPTFLPNRPDPGFKLSAANKWLTIEMDQPFGACGSGDLFLGRFWINGQPVVRKLSQPVHPETLKDDDVRIELIHTGWHPTKRLALHMGAVLKSLSARPGDRVTVQLLFCEAGWQELFGHPTDAERRRSRRSAEVSIRPDDPRLARLSNTVEFVMP
jgi:hypothetical protein